MFVCHHLVQLLVFLTHSNKLVGAGSGVSVPNNVIGGGGVSFIVPFCRSVCVVARVHQSTACMPVPTCPPAHHPLE